MSKSMKTCLIVSAVIVGLMVVGVAVFIVTFDADRYRPLVVSKLEAALGAPVSLKRLSLGWRGGIAAECQGLTVAAVSSATGEPALQVDTVSAVLRLMPLLHRKVEIASVVIVRPRVHVSRDAAGRVQIAGLAGLGAPAAVSGQTASVGGAPLSVQVSSFRIEDATIHWTDATTTPPMDVSMTSIDATLQAQTLAQPADFSGRAALFSDAPNLSARGHLRLPMAGQPARIEDLRVEVELSHLDAARLAHAFGQSTHAGLEKMAGTLVMTVGQLSLDPAGLQTAVGHVQLTDGKLVLPQLSSPIESLTIDAQLGQGRAELTRGSASVAGGTISLTGALESLSASPQLNGQLTVERVALQQCVPTPQPNEPQVQGALSASLHVTAQGKDSTTWSRSLSGDGTAQVTDGAIANLNILREVFQRLSILPGLVERLQARLPESYQSKFNARDTRFGSFGCQLKAEPGALAFQQLTVTSDGFALDGEGRVGFDGVLNVHAWLRIDPELSEALARSVEELRYLNDAQGRMTMPLVIQGQLPRVAVLPDVQYVASRLITTKAEEVLGNLLQKALKKREPSSEQSAP